MVVFARHLRLLRRQTCQSCAMPDKPESSHSMWWKRSWQDRFDSITASLGPALDEIATLSWANEIRVPGACVLTLPPVIHPSGETISCPIRNQWLHLSMGMSQPVEEFTDGRGYELGVLTADACSWPAELMYDLVTYLTEDDAQSFSWGDRFGFGIYLVDGVEKYWVGGSDLPAIGELRALLIWPYLAKPQVLTSTGAVDLLIATGITQGEWDLAKGTSSAHLLLWLSQQSVGQRTDLARTCLARDQSAMAQWRKVSELNEQEVLAQLTQ
jgi:hypothetical protein